MVGTKGLEPSTSRSRTVRSSQLSYVPTDVENSGSSGTRVRFFMSASPEGSAAQLSYVPTDASLRE